VMVWSSSGVQDLYPKPPAQEVLKDNEYPSGFLTRAEGAAALAEVEGDLSDHEELVGSSSVLGHFKIDGITIKATEGILSVATGGEYATTATYEATITTTWTGAEAPYSQVIEVTGIISGEVCTVDIDLTDATDYEEEQAIATDWAKIYRIVASDTNEITVYATAETTIAMPVTIKAVR